MTDITVTQIINIRHSRLPQWRRIHFAPRRWDAAVLMTEGKIAYDFENITVTAEAGDLLFLPGDLPYSGRPLAEPVGFFVLDFSCSDPHAFARLGAPRVCAAEDFPALFRQFSEVTEAWQKQQRDAHLRGKGFVYDLLCRTPAKENPTKTVTPTGQILEYILEHLSDPALSVDSLCQRFFISQSQLRRNIRKATGLKPNEYILRQRLRRAEGLLTDTDMPVKAVAESCGFSSPYYFSRCFCAHTGLPPRQYRKNTES